MWLRRAPEPLQVGAGLGGGRERGATLTIGRSHLPGGLMLKHRPGLGAAASHPREGLCLLLAPGPVPTQQPGGAGGACVRRECAAVEN